MKLTKQSALLLAAFAIVFCARQMAFAQEPPPSTPTLAADAANQGIVYLKPEYAEALKATGLLDGNKLSVSVLSSFDNDFAGFTRKGTNGPIYLPKTAILYMNVKSPKFDVKF